MKRLLAIVVILAAACKQTDAAVIGPGQNGRPRVAVTCVRDLSLCYSRAARECPRGFDVVDSAGQQSTAYVAQSNCYGSSCTTTATPIPRYDGTLIVDCMGP